MTCASEAEKTVTKDRQAVYGSPTVNFERIAELWSVVFDRTVTPEQAALCMILVKVAREIHTHKHDNLVDICGYALVLESIHKEKSSPNAEYLTNTGAKHDGF